MPPAAGMIGQWGSLTMAQPALDAGPDKRYLEWGQQFMHYSYFKSPLTGLGS